MVWNIIKKDWKLMGRAALGVIALQLLFEFPQMQPHPFQLPRLMPVLLTHPLTVAGTFLWPLVAILWVIALVHQDPLPGTRQDWLIRPVPRKDMLLAKGLLAVMVLQGSIILGDLLQGLGHGLPLGQTLRAALIRALMSFLILTIPALLLGALTQNITETVMVAASLCVGFLIFTRIAVRLAGEDEHLFDPTMGSGMYWLPNLLRLVILLAGAAAILAMQYRWRKTAGGRIAVAALAMLILCTQIIPWKPVWAVQKALSPQPGAADGIAIDWNIHPGPHDSSSSGIPWSGGVTDDRRYYFEKVWLHLPVTITGLPADAVVIEDMAQVVVTDADGNRLQATDGGGHLFLREGARIAPYVYKQIAPLPKSFYQQNPDRMVRIQTTYFMTLFKFGPSYSLPAVNGDRMIPGLGRCKTSINLENTSADAICLQMGKAPVCETTFMEDPRDGSRNRPFNDCAPDYGPYLQRPIPDAVTYKGFYSQFRNPDFLGDHSTGQFAVNAAKVNDAQFVIRTYQVAEHFTRVVNSPLIPLKDVTELKW